jgi:hypothetical protein
VKKAPSHPYGCGELQHGFALSTHWFDCFCANPSVVSFANSLSHFYCAGVRLGELLVDRLRLLKTHDQRLKVVLQLHLGGAKGVHHFWGQWMRMSAFRRCGEVE